ncbi:SDR family oxidoreductase [Fontibacillus sp. BL9]|uniref:SDR family oxidoreductase n=1 Tax=Fontibacillus sp. BL9 TaxID=3389971 RepID=UPI00397E45DE
MTSYKEMFRLTGKVAIVTGSLGILGRNFCSGLAESGASVAVVDLNEREVAKFATELEQKYHSQALGVGCDVSQPDEVAKMVQQVVSHFGKVDILHNNAASKSSDLEQFLAPFEEYSLETWREVMSVNLDGFFLVAKEVGKQMIEQGNGGSIIQTASIYGAMAPDHRIYEGSFYMGKPISSPAVYSASKGGVIALTKYLATYWAKYGIRVNTLTPGGVESGQNDEFYNKYSARIPLGRMASQHDMVGALLYLASDASSYVTGQNIMVDGGLSAW